MAPPLNTTLVTSVLPGAFAPVETVNMIIVDSVAAGLTATPSGTQANSLVLAAKSNSVSVVATAGDGVRLPPATAGSAVTIRNGAANAMNVFPASAAQGGVTGGDAINALAVNTAFSQVTGTVTYRCYVTGVWETA